MPCPPPAAAESARIRPPPAAGDSARIRPPVIAPASARRTAPLTSPASARRIQFPTSQLEESPAMAFHGSSSTQGLAAPKLGERTRLPLLPCPKCGDEVLELICGQASKVPGAVFFKCRSQWRDVPGTCPWFLFAEKYVKMLIEKGKIEKDSVVVKMLVEKGLIGSGVVASSRREESLPPVDDMRITIRHIEGLVEANRTELVPLLDELVSLENGAVRVDEKLQKLVDIGKIAALCLVVLAVFVVLGVLMMLVK